mmetsp:Transcript_3720/g.8990  ORF Transcript_3720/g.8990 Transcript_3720/m.8990 type:complete len:104 (-) Transcript_3720:127-438(-)
MQSLLLLAEGDASLSNEQPTRVLRHLLRSVFGPKSRLRQHVCIALTCTSLRPHALTFHVMRLPHAVQPIPSVNNALRAYARAGSLLSTLWVATAYDILLSRLP